MTPAILAIDQGTSGTKAAVVGADGRLLAEAYRPVAVSCPGPGIVEVDPHDLLSSVLDSGREALAAAATPVVGVSLANQGETVLAWDRSTGTPLSTCVVWQDRRATDTCARLAHVAERLAEISGLPLDPYFTAPKMRWLRDNVTAEGVVTSTDTWLLHHLTGAFVTDAATASRSMLLDVERVEWSDEAWDLFGLDGEQRPEVVPCDAVVGRTDAFGPSLPVAGVVVDQQAALWAQRATEVGAAKCTYGTGAFLVVNVGDRPVRSRSGLALSLAWEADGQRRWCLDGQVHTAGRAVAWLRDIGVLDDVAQIDALAAQVDDTAGVYFVPTLAGLAAPYWEPGVQGAFFGLTLAATRSHLVRAVCLGIAAQVADLAGAAAADLGTPVTTLKIDGGLTRSRVLAQLQADLLGAPVEVCTVTEATVLGAADFGMRALTGLPVALPANGRVVEPVQDRAWAAETLARWRTGLDLARRWNERLLGETPCTTSQ
ncbi:FGGY family carbohydrate kinase [Nocardiopsis ansamitocini]|uniref:ATP:glycerol 3-phosphotransferase n=1 Tax=Nocardiopsis ansamitocini TaxID=1670832 RepID=A0A9W6PB50_9ACTN|nr:FGGY family carbohydrate kinase [Nocardiopsis ansamitocini]GLU50334.1 carbohydrate kinase [Nocardiopsis ansamitocini]